MPKSQPIWTVLDINSGIAIQRINRLQKQAKNINWLCLSYEANALSWTWMASLRRAGEGSGSAAAQTPAFPS